MADIRINSLPSTATSFNTDDYIAIDGASGGTRRMLAANPPFSDVTLGTSGPSVKSTLSARAPRQGLVFDGTAGATVASVPAFGTGAFTVAAWVSPVATASTQYIFSGGSTAFGLRLLNGGTIQTTKMGTADNTASSGTLTAGKTALVVYTRSGTTGTYYINGVAAGTTTDSQDYPVAVTVIGKHGFASQDYWTGSILTPIAENRALSASEVVSLYEAGAPAGADYPVAVNGVAAGGNLLTSGVWNSGGTGITVSGTSNTGFTASGTGNNAFAGGVFGQIGSSIAARVGMRYRATWTYTAVSGETPTVGIAWDANGVWSNTVSATAGSGIFTVTTNQNVAKLAFLTSNGAATSYSVSNITLTPLGLLLAPDAAQAGGGLVWYDTSGNAANITLPASGVTWNVPSSRVLGGNWTTSGNLTVSGTGNSSVAGKLAINGGDLSASQFAIAAPSGSLAATLTAGATTNQSFGLRIFAGTSASDYALKIRNVGDTSTLLNVDGVGATTIGGNLTVSGSSFLIGGGSGSQSAPNIAWTFSSQTGIFFPGGTVIGFTQGASETARFSGGNFLVGTTIDGGQKLQVSGTAAITGQTILGSSAISSNQLLSIKKDTANFGLIGLSNSNTAGYSSIELFDNTSTQTGAIGYGNASVGVTGVRGKVYMYSSGDIAFLSGGTTTALTIDSSQNAIFAGSTGVQLKNDSFLYFGSTVRTAVKGNSTGSLELYANNNLSLTLDSSANATFTGGMVKITPESGYDSYIGFSTNRDSYLTAKNAGSHYLRGYDGSSYVIWAEFNRNRVFLVNTASAPAANPTGGGYLYVESGALKYRGSSGTVTTIANA